MSVPNPQSPSSPAGAVGAPQTAAEDGLDPAENPYQPSFPIVGIGASAGGLQAFTELLKALPADTGMGFVLVQHLSPGRVSTLPEILGRASRMPVTQAQADQPVQPNCVYVIPSDLDMCVARGVLELVPRHSTHGQHRPIDQFFRSLADDQAHCAIGVILSGTANDGAVGVEDIRAVGGITFAQDDSAQQESMPRSAMATGCVDFVLPPHKIAQELARIGRHPHTAPEPPDGTEGSTDAGRLARILTRLSRATGVDFTHYKASPLSRRVSRRMALRRLDKLEDYERFLRDHPEEMDALYEDVLIHVTRFFRDPEVFEKLRAEVLPRLLRDRSPQEPIRVWVLGCATGEEAYSMAIACVEAAEELGVQVPVHVFASDLSAGMIEKARAGVYPQSIALDVSPERLRRFFTEVSGGYHVSRAIRETCVFGSHNVLSAPPFSRMDLVSCRNLLIYLGPALQQEILPLLHNALKPGGFLVLGKSETTGASRDLFEVEDSRHRIYTRKAGTPVRLTGGQFPAATGSELPNRENDAKGVREWRRSGDVQREANRILASRFAPPVVLVGPDLEILQFWGDTSPYLAATPGKATQNVLRMARPGLLVALRAAIHRARSQEAPVRHEGLHARSDSVVRHVNLEVVRVPTSGAKAAGFLVLFQDATSGGSAPGVSSGDRSSAVHDAQGESLERENLRLTQELTATREFLQSMIEQEQAINEELQTANEEAQSANEGMQSINEELETSKEEIQATNEELTTVNDELQDRNEELHRINNDWHNLLQSVEVPIIILGRDLRIRQFSPVAGEVLHLMPADTGRPLGDVNLGLNVDLEPLVAEVIETQSSQEREVLRRGRWYFLRLRPYQTLDKKVDGAVLVLVDVDTLKRAQRYAEAIMSRVREPLLVLDHELRVRTANRSYFSSFRVTAAETEGRLLFELGNRQWDLPHLRRLLEEVVRDDTSFEDFLVERDFEQIGPRSMRLNARRLPAEPGVPPQVLLAIEDITTRRLLEDTLRLRAEELAEADRSKNEFLAMLGHELRNPLAPVMFANELLARHPSHTPTLLRHSELIDRQIRQLGRLLDDLLEGSRASRGMVTLHLASVDLVTLVCDCVAAASMSFELRRQEISCTAPSEPVLMHADPGRLEQVITNLLNNASKYTEPGGAIRVALELEPGEAVLRVSDTGIGISAGLLPRIFDLFTQGERSLDRSQGGLGVGLTLVRSLVELHHGTVEARSDGLGCGSEFIVRLPLQEGFALTPESRARACETLPEGAQPVALQPRVLVVDDNRDSADTLVELGEAWGYDLRAVYDGASAIEAACSYHPQVVLLDIGLPGMDGYAVAKALRQEVGLAGVRLVAFTGYGGGDDRERARKAGFDHHLTKPVDTQELRALLAVLLQPTT